MEYLKCDMIIFYTNMVSYRYIIWIYKLCYDLVIIISVPPCVVYKICVMYT